MTSPVKAPATKTPLFNASGFNFQKYDKDSNNILDKQEIFQARRDGWNITITDFLPKGIVLSPQKLQGKELDRAMKLQDLLTQAEKIGAPTSMLTEYANNLSAKEIDRFINSVKFDVKNRSITYVIGKTTITLVKRNGEEFVTEEITEHGNRESIKRFNKVVQPDKDDPQNPDGSWKPYNRYQRVEAVKTKNGTYTCTFYDDDFDKQFHEEGEGQVQRLTNKYKEVYEDPQGNIITAEEFKKATHVDIRAERYNEEFTRY